MRLCVTMAMRSAFFTAVMLDPIAICGQTATPSSPLSTIEDKKDDADLAAYPVRLSFKVTKGSILIKGPKGVRPGALTKARDKIRVSLADADPAIVERLWRTPIPSEPRNTRLKKRNERISQNPYEVTPLRSNSDPVQTQSRLCENGS